MLILRAMTEPFTLSVDQHGQNLAFTAQLLLQGYSHKFSVMVNDLTVLFEPDEEGIYRAMSMPGQAEGKLPVVDKELLGLIGLALKKILA